MAAITITEGYPVIAAADLADITHDCNLAYPNGIGKRRGMFVLSDSGTELELFMADGSATNDKWMGVGTQATADVTPV